MEMRAIDVLNNIKNNEFDIGHYGLCKAEADVVIDALEKQIPHKLEPCGTSGDIVQVSKWQCKCGNIITGKVADYCYKCGRRITYGDEYET